MNDLDAGRVDTLMAGGLFAVLWIIKGDMEFIQNYLHLAGSGCVHMCPWCLANTIEDPDDLWAAMLFFYFYYYLLIVMKISTFVFWLQCSMSCLLHGMIGALLPLGLKQFGPLWLGGSFFTFFYYTDAFCCSKVAELAWREKPLAPLVFLACCEYLQPCCRCAAHS